MTRWRRGLVGIGLCGSLFACAQSTPSDSVSESQEPKGAYAEFAGQLWTLICQELAKCCGADFSQSRCDALLGNSSRLEATAADEDRFKFNTEKAEQCLADVKALGVCGPDLPSSCNEVTEGTLGGEEPCNSSAECASTPVSPGICYAVGDSGEICETPVRLVGEGVSCAATCFAPNCRSEGGEFEFQCDGNEGFFCNDEGVCQRQGRIGEPCTSYHSCTRGAVCRDSVCLARRNVGDSCTNVDDCSSGTYCNANAVCAAKHPIGAACDVNESQPCFESGCTDGRCVAIVVALFCSVSAS